MKLLHPIISGSVFIVFVFFFLNANEFYLKQQHKRHRLSNYKRGREKKDKRQLFKKQKHKSLGGIGVERDDCPTP